MLIELKKVNYAYDPDKMQQTRALSDVDLSIDRGEFIAVIGHTGSGKSTLVQHLNGLLLPTTGDVFIDGINSRVKGAQKLALRKKVGLVFQYPEYQLFETTVYEDIAFGPRNMGVKEEDMEQTVKEAMLFTGLNYEEIKDKSPFELSGGQKRRVAIAGVVAMKPEVLVLDEPTAGLDPQGRDELLEQLQFLFQSRPMTIILVSHSMEDVAKICSRVIVVDQGRIMMDGPTKEVFRHKAQLESVGLSVPMVTQFCHMFRERGGHIPDDIITVSEAFEYLKTHWGGKRS